MLCSVCKSAEAVIFVDTPTKDDPKHVTGYCLNCARAKGINPVNSSIEINDADLKQIAEQFETMFNNISNNLELSDMDFDDASSNMVPIRSNFWQYR